VIFGPTACPLTAAHESPGYPERRKAPGERHQIELAVPAGVNDSCLQLSSWLVGASKDGRTSCARLPFRRGHTCAGRVGPKIMAFVRQRLPATPA